MPVESNASRPDISVVYLTASDLRPLAAVLRRLGQQTVASRTEVLVVAPEASRVTVPPSLAAPFHSLRILGDPRRWIGGGRALALRDARAPYVAFGEDHCYPDPRWLEMLLARHVEGCVVVGPELRNDNPGTCRSWTSFLLAYGTWAAPAVAGPARNVAGHNCSYLRSAVLEFDKELDGWLDAETILQWMLADRGARIVVEPRAAVSHVNVSSARYFLAARLGGSRFFAAVWSRDWPLVRRLKFAVISPAIALKRLGEMNAVMRRQAPGFAPKSRMWPLIVVSLLAAGMGYALGFLFGGGATLREVYREELERQDFLCPDDRRRLEADRAVAWPT